MLWNPSRESALHRLQEFIPTAGSQYAAKRNYDFGVSDRANVSCLSPYVSRRLILESEIIEKVLEAHSLPQAEKFIQEVLWRTYWKGWLEMRPSVWDDYRKLVAQQPDRNDLYWEVINAESKFEFMNAWTRELIDTGYLHNHTRMWYASFWIHTLRLPWHWGADFFFRHLLDGDIASNTLSWRWVAGLQTKGKTYLASAENISNFTGGRVRIESEVFSKSPFVAKELNELTQLKTPLATSFSESIAGDSRDTLLLMHDEDMCLENSALKDHQFMGLLALNPRSAKSGVQSERVLSFVESGLADAVQRAEKSFRLRAIKVKDQDQLIENIQSGFPKVRKVVSLAAGTGYLSDHLKEIALRLEELNIEFSTLTRPWDQQLFPLASAGFFKFRERANSIILS